VSVSEDLRLAVGGTAAPPAARPPVAASPLRRVIDAWHRLLTWLLIATVGILVLPVTLQIVSRFTHIIPHYIWTEELSRFLFIWMVMLGAMIGIREATHFEVDIWPELGPRPAAALRIVSHLSVLVFALVFLWYGIKFVEFGWYQESELAELPMIWIFLAWPAAGATWLLFLAEAFHDNLRILAGRAAP
jgi:TRAP-type transport system small permease protein